MNIVRIIGLAAALACSGPLYAQRCSGGPDGGVDATGNQCSTPGYVAGDAAGYLVPSRTESAQTAAKTTGRQRSVPVVEHLRPVVMSVATAAASTARPSVAPASRYAKAAPAAAASASSLNAEFGSGSQCSGGADGGMDSTGNQCSDTASADTNVSALLAAAH